MTFKSALQDLKETTLTAVSGLLGKMAYLASLHGPHGYEHWGLALVHGQESSERALKTAHSEIMTGVLRTPLGSLEQDLEESSRNSGLSAGNFVEKLQAQFDDLLPGGRKDSPAALHLNSVLVALSLLESNRERATPSAS
jgi:hypothetical protein